jgi:hypothetical protein
MAQAPQRQTKDKTPLERMTDLTRRLVAVPKSELPKTKTRSTHRRTNGKP